MQLPSHILCILLCQPKSYFFYSNYVGNVNQALQHSAPLSWTGLSSIYKTTFDNRQHLTFHQHFKRHSGASSSEVEAPLGRRLQTPDPVLSTVRYSTKLMHQTTFCGSTIIHTVEGMTACTLSARPVRGVEVRGLPCT